MSTQARRAPIPPRPSQPPTPRDELADASAGPDASIPPRPAHTLAADHTPPPPPASARFPDTPPVPGAPASDRPAPATRPGAGPLPPERPTETTTRLRPIRDTAVQSPDGPPPPATPPAAAPRHPATPPRGPGEPHATVPRPAAPPRVPGEPPVGRRPVGAVDLTPGPGAGRPFVFFARPASYDDSTTRLRPIGSRIRPRVATAAACAVLGLGLIGGAATGSWLTGDSGGSIGSPSSYAAAGTLWHSVPVDRIFPPVIKGDGAGPGGADRTWTRIAVAPDSTCDNAFDPLLQKALAPAGCLRLLRATYTDATRSHVTTVGLLFTKADTEAMKALRTRFTEDGLDRRNDLMPHPYAAKGTLAAGFGDAQRASWTISVLTDAPVVAYAVSGFADARTVTDPQPAAEAMKSGSVTTPAQAGLGYEAQGIADRVERSLRAAVAKATEEPS
ncbi:hypothetical protein OG758_37255 [Streptomyces sp. NBC_01474]|uniref:hypothetical protein n=1 Tax=unclassified Streptomyces TaxID=2593676 RepID=UPI002DD8677F|nr:MULTISPECIES: hypothetical protein [unclassified Streptomyces]WSD99315.1 hypothetical protein OG758_37255 [Streptomyces sp. NBC_01474]